MFDANKFEQYYNKVLSQVYDEGESPFHKNLTTQVVNQVILPLELPHNAVILDVGCGPGYFLDEMAAHGYEHTMGITYSQADLDNCTARGHKVAPMDISFLTHEDDSVDFLFSRHSIEHSPFPYITLLEYYRVIAPDGLMYVEVPAPDCSRQHEYNQNHYSILGIRQWHALFLRAGFELVKHNDFTVNLTNTETNEKFDETYLMFLLRKPA
jgi:ubiquinone/menaquinone biosynthesis C-methylase UbiE